MPGSTISTEDSPLRQACLATSLESTIQACAAFPPRSVILVVPTSTHVRSATAMWMRAIGAGLPPRVFTMSNLMRRLASLYLPEHSLLSASDASILLRQAAIANRTTSAALGLSSADVLQWKAHGTLASDIRAMADEERPLPRRTERILDVWDTYERWKGGELLDHVDVSTSLAEALLGADANVPFVLPGDETPIQGIVVTGVHVIPVAERAFLLALAPHVHVGVQWLRAPEDVTERTRNFEHISEFVLRGWSYEHVPTQRATPLREIVRAVRDRHAEVRAALTLAKQGLLAGTHSLGDICIVAPGNGTYDNVVRDVAMEASVALSTKERMRLAQCGVSSAVVAALDMMGNGWRRADVERLLRSGFVRSGEGLDLMSVLHVSARLRIHGGEGSDEWLQRIERRRATIDAMPAEERNDREILRERTLLDAARRGVQWLQERCMVPHGTMSAAAFRSIVQDQILRDLGIQDVAMARAHRAEERMLPTADRAAVEAINDALQRYERMTVVAGAPPLTVLDHGSEFRRLVREATVGVDDVRLQGVTLATSADMVRGREWKLVVMLGCVEGEFPQMPRDADDGLPPDELLDRGLEDLFDIRACVADTEDALLLATFPLKIDGADTMPSQFLDDREAVAGVDVAILDADVVLSTRERMLRTKVSVQDVALQQQGDVVHALSESEMQQLIESVEPYVSPSRLDIVAACPYRFFARYALRLPQTDDEQENLSGRDRGSLLHGVVRMFYEDLQGLASTASLEERINHPVDLRRYAIDDLKERLLRCYDRVAKRYEVDHMYEEVEQRVFRGTDAATGLLVRWLLVEYEHALPSVPQPALFEYDIDTDVLVGETSVRVKGRIDRIDVLHEGALVRFSIADYKSTKASVPTLPSMQRGEHSQMLLYILGVQAQWKAAGIEAEPNTGLYQTFGSRLAMRESDEVLRREFSLDDVMVAEKKAEAFIQIARSGKYPVKPRPSACVHCSYSEICRKDHWGTVS